jgi:phenylalanyl-tRNA synthetase alpha chain
MTTPSPDTPLVDSPSGSPELQRILGDLSALFAKALSELQAAPSLAALEELKIAYLGKKGELSRINRDFGFLSNEEKPLAGKSLNEVKTALTTAEQERREALELEQIQERLKSERVDVTLPASPLASGHYHPITQTKRQIEAIFRSMGFRVTESPEIEAPWVNFDALNFLPDHPARDMQDTFFTERGHVLRTHTSGNQIRALMNAEPPIAVIHSGKVYRCDSDSTHSPMFHQMEGILVGENISMAHLKGTLQEFLVNLFGESTKVRFRPSFFPFTEPSAEVDIECDFTGQGWMEVLGCGMIHPNVLRNCNIDPEKYTGFAFGLGLDRLAMLKFGITNIRLLYENDQRFLSQF